MLKAFFVCFEGIDNSGKTSVTKDTAHYFSSKVPVYFTRELTTDVGYLIKKYLKERDIDIFEKVLLFAADRQRRYKKDIEPRLSENCLLVADRWFYSAYAYRCAEDSKMREYTKSVNAIFPNPDVTILIDITASESIARGILLNKNNYKESFLEKVRQEYLLQAGAHRFKVINGMRPYREIKTDVLKMIDELLRTAGLIR